MVGPGPSGSDDSVCVSRGGCHDPIGNFGAGAAAGDQSNCRHSAGGTCSTRCLGHRRRSCGCADRAKPQLGQHRTGAAGDGVGCRAGWLPLVAPKQIDLATVAVGRCLVVWTVALGIATGSGTSQ